MAVSEIPVRKPPWLRRKISGGPATADIFRLTRSQDLHTVCQSARCPNIAQCWEAGTATFMLLGNVCTRGCRFCDVPKGRPRGYDREEPQRILYSARQMGLKHVVLTSVNRDDLPDQGSGVWAETIGLIKKEMAGVTVETLIPDMQGNLDRVDEILGAGPDILNHNFETVHRLQKPVRGRGNTAHSSLVLQHAKQAGFITKTSLMLGLGETDTEVREMIRYIADLQVDILTLGQYLSPGKGHLAVERYLSPREFSDFKTYALAQGIPVCESGPFQRSSFKAWEAMEVLSRRT